MKAHQLLLKVLRPFRSLVGQILISLLAAVGVAYYVGWTQQGRVAAGNMATSDLMTILGVVAGLLALASSIAYGHHTLVLTESRARLSDAYTRFRDQIESLLELCTFDEMDSELHKKVASLAIDASSRRLEYLTFQIDWEALAKPITEELDRLHAEQRYGILEARVVAHLHRAEELLSELHVASVGQVITLLIVRPVLKSLGLLVLIMLVGAGLYLIPEAVLQEHIAIGLVTLITTFSVLIFLDIGTAVYRHTHEFSYAQVTDLDE